MNNEINANCYNCVHCAAITACEHCGVDIAVCWANKMVAQVLMVKCDKWAHDGSED
jgi:hypothetical protein